MLGHLDLELRGNTRVAGRGGIVVRAAHRQVDSPPFATWLLLGSDEIELVVDREIGILLRVTALLAGRPFHVSEIVDVAFDETFPDETFRIDLPPGEAFQRADRPRLESLSLDQAVRTAPFTLFVPGRLAAGWQFSHAVSFRQDREDTGGAFHLTYRHDAGAHHFMLGLTAGAHPWLDVDGMATVERDGMVMRTLESPEDGAPRQVVVRLEGTNVNVNSQDLPLDELIEIAASLVPAPDSPPPAVSR